MNVLSEIISTNNAMLYEGCPWGKDVLKLLVLYNTNSHTGGYILLPKFKYGEGIVSPKLIGAGIKELAIAGECTRDISFEEFMKKIHHTIGKSFIWYDEDEYDLVFDGTLISKHVDSDSIGFYRNTKRILRFFFDGCYAFAESRGKINPCVINYA